MADDPQYVTFGIEREVFAIPVGRVQEILDVAPITRLPRAPEFLLGLMDVRGEAVPVVDMRVRLGRAGFQTTEHTRVIIVDLVGGASAKAGLVTDRVYEVTALEGIDREVPPGLATWRSDCVSGIGRRGADFVIILKLDETLDASAFAISPEEARSAA